MADWNGWKDVSWVDEFSILYGWPGVYEIRLAGQNGQPIGLGRFLDIDAEGLLVIGESNNVASRP